MQYPARKWLKAAPVCVVAILAAGYVALPSSRDDSPQASQLLDPRAALYNDMERETTKPVTAAQSDSELEDQAARPMLTVVQVDRGDTLLDLLMKAGVERQEAHSAIQAMREVYNPRDLKVGQQVTVTFDRAADGLGTRQFHEVSLQPDAGRQVTAKRSADQNFAAQEIKRELTKTVSRFSGTIKSSLFETASTMGLSPSAVVEMIRVLSYDVDFQRDVQQGDSFAVMLEQYVDKKGKVVREGDLLYAGMTLSGNSIALYRYVDGGGLPDYYNTKGESVKKALLRTPVDGARLSSGYGNRKHPILGYNKMHKGIDFAAPTGTPIMAAGAGVVEQAGPNGAYGNYVRIRHSSGYSTAYAHMSRFAQGIRSGKRIEQGQTIGFVGSTGRSTGAHLHYEVLTAGSQINPLSIKVPTGTKLAGKELDRFNTAMTQTMKTFAQLPDATKVASNSRKSAPAPMIEAALE